MTRSGGKNEKEIIAIMNHSFVDNEIKRLTWIAKEQRTTFFVMPVNLPIIDYAF
jgi:hypothetical protein